MAIKDGYPKDYTLTIKGVDVVAVPDEGAGCAGCFGKDDNFCNNLPAGCSHREIIWVPSTPESRVKAAILKLEES